MYEDRAVLDSVGRSASLIKKRWGEGVVGYGSVAVALAIVTVPIVIAGGILAAFSLAAGITLMVAGYVGLIVLGGTIGQVFTAALCRFAADGVVTAPFGREQLENQYQSRAERKKSSPALKGIRIAWTVLIIVTLGLRLVIWLFHR